MTLIISGPGFSGKSEFIKSRGAGLVDFGPDFEVHFLAPAIKNPSVLEEEGAILHANMSGVRMKEGTPSQALFARIAAQETTHAVLLVTPQTLLLERIHLLGAASGRTSEQLKVADTQASGNLEVYFARMLGYFDALNVPVTLIESQPDGFAHLDRADINATLAKEVTQTKTTYSRGAIKALLEEASYARYHRVELPFGLRARGQAVSERFPLFFPKDMTGWSMLDIGSAHGAFAFEAERRGATVTAYERSPDRLAFSKKLGEILGSNVALESHDFLEIDTPERYDMVLLANVLHHLPDAEIALRKAIAITKRALVIEYPTLQDPKFAEQEMKMNVGPVLSDNIHLFSRVSLYPSSNEGRVIAICTPIRDRAPVIWPTRNPQNKGGSPRPAHERDTAPPRAKG